MSNDAKALDTLELLKLLKPFIFERDKKGTCKLEFRLNFALEFRLNFAFKVRLNFAFEVRRKIFPKENFESSSRDVNDWKLISARKN